MTSKQFLSIGLALFTFLSVAGAELNLVCFGDQMEYQLGLQKACENAGQNVTSRITSEFADCTGNISSSDPTDMFGSWVAICQNRGKYLSCWDSMKESVLKECGKDKEPVLPVLYRTTLSALCGSDNAAKRIEEIKKAFTDSEQEKLKTECSQYKAMHWMDNCKPLLPTMTSTDLCARHTAIDQCLHQVTCSNIKFVKLMTQVYTDGRPYLQCNDRRI